MKRLYDITLGEIKKHCAAWSPDHSCTTCMFFTTCEMLEYRPEPRFWSLDGEVELKGGGECSQD